MIIITLWFTIHVDIIDISDLPGVAELAKFAMCQTGQSGLESSIFVGERQFVKNPSNGEIVLMPGALLMGFGKGTWGQNIDNSIDVEKCPKFVLESDESLVLHNNQLQSVREVVKQQRVVGPNCKVAYHEIADKAAATAGAFDVN